MINDEKKFPDEDKDVNGYWTRYSEEQMKKMVDYLVEGNTKEDLALHYIEAIGEGGTNILLEEIDKQLKEYRQYLIDEGIAEADEAAEAP